MLTLARSLSSPGCGQELNNAASPTEYSYNRATACINHYVTIILLARDVSVIPQASNFIPLANPLFL